MYGLRLFRKHKISKDGTDLEDETADNLWFILSKYPELGSMFQAGRISTIEVRPRINRVAPDAILTSVGGTRTMVEVKVGAWAEVSVEQLTKYQALCDELGIKRLVLLTDRDHSHLDAPGLIRLTWSDVHDFIAYELKRQPNAWLLEEWLHYQEAEHSRIHYINHFRDTLTVVKSETGTFS